MVLDHNPTLASKPKRVKSSSTLKLRPDLMCVMYTNKTPRLTSTWMGSQKHNRSNGSRHHFPTAGKINFHPRRTRMWCGAIGCRKRIEYVEDSDTGELRYIDRRKYHHCIVPARHRGLMREWWETRMWKDIRFVTGVCSRCKNVSKCVTYGIKVQAPIVWIGKTFMMLVCKRFKVAITIQFNRTPVEVIPAIKDYKVVRILARGCD